MKASIKFRDEQKPLLRAKIPLNILNLPFQSGVSTGGSKELSLNLSTCFESGPSVKFSYRPNDSQNPFSFVFRTGIGHFGSPSKSPLVMSAEFNLVGNHSNSPTFFIHFKPDFGNFSLKKSHSSSGFVKTLNGRSGDANEEGFSSNGYFNPPFGSRVLNETEQKGNGLFPVTPESKEVAGLVVNGLMKGTEVSARTAVPLGDFAEVNFRWSLKVPPQEAAEEADTVVVGTTTTDRIARISLPLLVMNKVGIQHVVKSKKKVEEVGSGGAKFDDELKKQLEVIRAENGLLGKALSDLRSDIAAGKLDFLLQNWNKYSSCGVDRRGNEDNRSWEVKGSGSVSGCGSGSCSGGKMLVNEGLKSP